MSIRNMTIKTAIMQKNKKVITMYNFSCQDTYFDFRNFYSIVCKMIGKGLNSYLSFLVAIS